MSKKQLTPEDFGMPSSAPSQSKTPEPNGMKVFDDPRMTTEQYNEHFKAFSVALYEWLRSQDVSVVFACTALTAVCGTFLSITLAHIPPDEHDDAIARGCEALVKYARRKFYMETKKPSSHDKSEPA